LHIDLVILIGMEKFAAFSLIVTAAAMASVMWPKPKVTEIQANFLARGDRNKDLNVLVTICLTLGAFAPDISRNLPPGW